MTTDRFWETKTLAELDRGQWEALCDGCGKCCLHKLEDDETGELYPTNVACKLLDRRTAQCKDYKNRRTYVPDCVRLTNDNVARPTGCPRPAPIACARTARSCPTGIIWSAATARRCTARANRRAAGRSARTMPATSNSTWSTARCERRTIEIVRHARARRMRLSVDPASGRVRLTLPPRASLKRAMAWAEEHRGWIDAQRVKLPEARPFAPGAVIPVEGEDVVIDRLVAPAAAQRADPGSRGR